MKKELLGIFLAFPGVVSAQYAGKVFADANGNGSWDKGEALLEGVSVSDGLNVVKTDKVGKYELPGNPGGRFLFVTLPSGYRAEKYYRRVEAGRLAYDFGLMRANPRSVKPDGTHRFAHISDTHMFESYRTAVDGYAKSVKDMLRFVENEDLAFVVHTGDIAREGFDSYAYFMNNENTPASQIFYCVGNHDLGEGKFGEENFENHFGPTYYSFEVGNVHYIVTPMWRGDGKPTYTNESIGRWLKNDLAQVKPGMPVIAFNHGVMSADGHFRFGSEEEGVVDLAEHNLKAWIYGHWHHDRLYKFEGSDVQMVCSPGNIRGSYDHSPSSFRVLTVNPEGNLSSDIRYPYIDRSVRFASIDNGRVATTTDGKVQLSVNAYSSVSPTMKVTYDCSCRDKVYASGKSLVQQSDFNWSAEVALPAALDGQVVTVTARATFANGDVAHESTSFRYRRSPEPRIRLGEDWSNFLQNPAHAPSLRDTLRLPLSPVWVTNLGANVHFTSPLVYRGNVYAASLDDNGAGRASVACLDACSGAVRWKYALRNSVRSSIAAGEGCVFAQDVNGWLYAIDCATGKLKWEKDLRMDKTVPLNNGLLFADGLLYAGTGRTLAAFRPQTGEVVWKNEGWDTGHGTATTLTLADGVLLSEALWEASYGNDARTGKKLWGRGGFGFGSSMSVVEELAYYISNRSLCVVEPRSGNVAVRKEYPFELKNLSTPLVMKREIIVGTAEGGVVAIDRGTLEVKWRFRTGEAMVYTVPTLGGPASPVESSPVACGDVVYVGASDGVLYALNRKDGQLLWKHEVGSPILSTVAVSGNALFVTDFAGNVYAFAASDRAGQKE